MKEEVKELIESGQLEAFVLGLLSPVEEQQVLTAAKTFPEVQQQIDRLAVDMESIDQQLSIAPPEHVKEGIMNELFPEETSESSNSAGLPVADNTKFVFWRNLAAASIFLAVTSFAAAVYFGNMYYETNDELRALLTENTQMAQDLQFNNVRLSELEVAFTITSDPNYQKVGLDGLEIQPGASLSVWWNQQSSETFLMVNNLAPLPSDKDYQLWAIVDGQPVDMGVLSDPDQGSFLKMNDINNAVAFAVTIEPKGGLPSPTLDQMCALGNVS